MGAIPDLLHICDTLHESPVFSKIDTITDNLIPPSKLVALLIFLHIIAQILSSDGVQQ